jgi:Protein of unknown function (DUF3048) N-terminal domain/Protein of unknown function (DUF3048) C-terminal domain
MLFALLGIAIAALGIVAAARIGTLLPSTAVAATASPAASVAGPGASGSATPAATPGAPTAPPPTPAPTPVLVPAPLTGLPVSPEAAAQHPIAVMVDDHWDARPQSGLNAAAVVWQAPAEGGVPRYMLVFQDQLPTSVGPIRSARQYYVEWAAEYRAMYVHHGGSPQALATLRAKGSGTWVWNADGFRWEGRYVFRVHTRPAPHNVYSDGDHLRALAKRLGADDGKVKAPWSFATGVARAVRPTGATIKVTYPYETIEYRYDVATNRYLRYINGAEEPQVDVADGKVVAPANVIVLRMFFGPLTGTSGGHGRLEAADVGKGVAWISTNGRTVKGTWKKASVTAPTLVFGPDGEPVTLTAGQTFVQVLALSYGLEITDGQRAWAPPMQAVD